jgi:hypothetical protein
VVPCDDWPDLEYKCDSPTAKLECDSLATLGFVKNKYSDGVDLANFVLKNKVGFMPCKVASFAEDSSVLAKGGEKCPVEHPPERCTKVLNEQNVPTSLTDEFEKCVAPVSAAFVVGVLERELTRPVKFGLSADFPGARVLRSSWTRLRRLTDDKWGRAAATSSRSWPSPSLLSV